MNESELILKGKDIIEALTNGGQILCHDFDGKDWHVLLKYATPVIEPDGRDYQYGSFSTLACIGRDEFHTMVLRNGTKKTVIREHYASYRDARIANRIASNNTKVV